MLRVNGEVLEWAYKLAEVVYDRKYRLNDEDNDTWDRLYELMAKNIRVAVGETHYHDVWGTLRLYLQQAPKPSFEGFKFALGVAGCLIDEKEENNGSED